MRINNFNEIIKQNSYIPIVQIKNPNNPLEIYKAKMKPYTGGDKLITPYAVWVDDDGVHSSVETNYVALVLLYTEGARKGSAEFRIIRKGHGINASHEFIVHYTKRDIASYGEFVDYISKTLGRLAYNKLVRKV